MAPRILIAGGYGAFGARVAERLARTPGLEIIIAGRHLEPAREQAARLRAHAKSRISSAVLDAECVSPPELSALSPNVVINASGPFQTQDYTLAKTAIAVRCHYIDLADARGYVAGIGALDRDARAAGIALISGASTVPGLSSAVLRHIEKEYLAEIETIDIGISPGNSFDPGLATTRSILGGAGRPITMRIDGRPSTVHGWQGSRRHDFPGVGPRRMGYVEVPDLDLFASHYPALKTIRTWAGVEIGLYHLGILALSGIVRTGLMRSAAPLSRPLLAVKRALRFLGSDQGGMFVIVTGKDDDGVRERIVWHIIAKSGHGPYIPAIPSALLARKLARREIALVGAMACFDLFTLESFMAEVADLDIRTVP